MATQQRSVIVTAIVLAVILGGSLVWLLNRTPANQLATQVPEAQFSANTAPNAGGELVATEEADRLAQAQGQAPTSGIISPTDGAVQGVAATAPTGPAENMLIVAAAALALGSGSALALLFPRLQRLSR